MPKKSARSQHAGGAALAGDEGAARSRPFWSGLLSFGLVSIPVELLSAHRSSAASLRQLDASDGTPLVRRYHCPEDDVDVDNEHLVHGHELPDGSFVVVTDEELEALAPKKSREIDLRLFVDKDSLDALYFERSYFLAPGPDSGKAYRLLGAVMERQRRAGIATFVMRDREYLVAIFSEDGLLRAETLRFAGEVRSPKMVGLGKPKTPTPARLKAIEAAVSPLAREQFVTKGLVAEHPQALRELAEKKHRKGQDVMTAPSGAAGQDEGAEIIDLMQVLQQSLERSGLASKSPANGKTPARRASATKSARAVAPSLRATRSKAKKRAAPSGGKAASRAHKKTPKARSAREHGGV